MTPARDRWVAAAALVVILILAGAVTGLVLDAQHAGISTRQSLRLEQVQIQARALDARFQQAYTGLGATTSTPGAFHMTPNDPDDLVKLKPLAADATSGLVLTDRHGVILNGSLLRDHSSIGRRFEREGMAQALRGEPTTLGVGPGLTTTDAVIGIALPVHAADGSFAGLYIYESPVSADSPFSQEVAQSRAGKTGIFSYVDASGIVTASSDESTLAKPIDITKAGLTPGFHRVRGVVTAVAFVPAARWRLVFQQSTSEFEGDLTGPVRTALLLLLLAGVVAGLVSVIALLRRLRAARDEQRRLAEISSAREEFTSIVSHELRTPVAGLLGFLQTTLDHWDEMSEDERLRAIGRAQQNAERLQHLTADVLETTTIESGQAHYRPEPGDLRDVVSEAVQTARDANAGREIELRAPDGLVAVQMDAPRIRQVVTNLLENAVKSSPVDAPVVVTITTEGSNAVVMVRDYGTGVPLDERERIFEKFTRGRSGSARGSGLGLYLAREILTAHGGTIAVDEADGPGAVLVFTIPSTGADRVAR
jgi:signal transduction histidine kinase